MIQVIKATGETEPFSEQKVLTSMRKAGVPDGAELEVLKNIKGKLYDKMPTSEIYASILDSLATIHPYAKSRYSLKQAIMLLGPTGYPFEDFVSKLLMEDGYQTRVRQIMWGKCVSHEIDVVAEKNDKIAMIEAKFHNNPGTRSEIHVALYTYARFMDVKLRYRFDEAWLVTNTKTTIDANHYATCMGMKVLSWSYPEGNSLQDLIQRTKLHPITMLTTLSSAQKMTLLRNHVVMCKDLRSNHEYLDLVELSPKDRKQVLSELDFICQ